jgi:hypothetical protein
LDSVLQLLASVIFAAIAFLTYRRWIVLQNDNIGWLLRFITLAFAGASLLLILNVFRSL